LSTFFTGREELDEAAAKVALTFVNKEGIRPGSGSSAKGLGKVVRLD
jgi:hypothetical protein